MRQILILITLCSMIACSAKREKKILVFTKTAGYHHASIKDGVKALFKLGKENKIQVDTTSDSSLFTEENLRQYSTILFLSTTGDVFDLYQQNAFERYIQAGGGYVGIHAASDTEYDWPWYNKLVGGYFASHPKIQEATLKVVDQSHQSTSHLDKDWIRKDEWYNFKSLYDATTKLITIDETSYKGGTNGKNHPMSWYHEYDGGRAWYTALGHTAESYIEEAFLKHILGGINYAIGNNKLDYNKATTPYKPEENRFTLSRLVEGIFTEPTEMTILPNLDVLVASRRGDLHRYYNSTGEVKKIGNINVYHFANVEDVNAEEGLMGLQKDPNFDKNGFIYLFYAVPDTSLNRLSRFYVDEDSIHMSTERTIMEFYSQRDICCHTGGSIAFSGDGKYLYISTGDNATPFNEKGQKYVNDGFAPQDNRLGHEQYDARRTSANTNDYRGKILRIIINEDGSYDIPEDNLFSVGTPKTKPEIYVMGNRNPYRISVDPKTNYLYWGEVGPDSNIDSDERGPMGYDEVNQAKAAGFFGWPLFVGNNKAYRSYDYDTGISGPYYEAKAPINISKNNTGLKELPPAQPAMIYYPYDKSGEFPELGSGGRNAMAGPVYYSDLYDKDKRLPQYFDGKLLIYDWIRQWIKVVSLDDPMTIEPFMPNTTFANIIDMEVAPTGEIYILEYGNGWFSKNNDASLTKIVYNSGNRMPNIVDFNIENPAGQAPHTFEAKVDVEDPENDELTFTWHLGPNDQETKSPNLTHTLKEIGELAVSVTVKDQAGNETYTKPIIVYSGNQKPQLAINIAGNQSMYFEEEPVKYNVSIDDDQELNKNNITIIKQMAGGTIEQLGHLNSTSTSIAESIISASDCQSCHKRDTTSIGPSYAAVSLRYKENKDAPLFLAEKIRLGGSGNWGEGAMAAHPTITDTEAMMISDWILSLANDEDKALDLLPQKGQVTIKYDKSRDWERNAFIRATYTDVPTNGAKPITTNEAFMLKPNFYLAKWLSVDQGLERSIIKNKEYRILPQEEGKSDLLGYDLHQIKKVKLILKSGEKTSNDYVVRLIDKDTNQIIGETIISQKQVDKGAAYIAIPPQKSQIKDYVLKSIGPGVETSGLVLLEKLIFMK